jgi:hypothetical protein
MQKFDAKLFNILLTRLRRLKNPNKLTKSVFKGDFISSHIYGKYSLSSCTKKEREYIYSVLRMEYEKQLELKRLTELRKKL